MNNRNIPFKSKTQQPAENKIPLPDNTVTCDICNNPFRLKQNTLKEETVTLEKDDWKQEVSLTYLKCPNCGKRYPVIVDDSSTLPILQELRECMSRRIQYYRRTGSIPQKLNEKYNKLNKKLDFKRRQLAEKFNGALYQSEGDTIQLDYRYHTR